VPDYSVGRIGSEIPKLINNLKPKTKEISYHKISTIKSVPWRRV
jgi:hypothetical protein